MNRNHLDNLKVFGFGLALFIPFIVLSKHLHHKVGFLLFALELLSILFILSKVNRLILPYLLLLGGIWASIIFTDHRPLETIAIVFLAISLGILTITFLNAQLLDGFYRYWMKVGHFIGMIVTATVLIIFYYLIFGLAGIVLQLMRKDLLDRSIDPLAKSYWLKKQLTFDKESYKRQF